MTDFEVFSRQLGNALTLQKIPISSNTPSNGDTITYDSSLNQWVFSPAQTGAGKVDRSGDTMTGDLFLSIASDVTRQLGCNDLQPGDTFRVLMGNATNAFIEYDENLGSLIGRGRSSVIFQTQDFTPTITLGATTITCSGDLDMAGNRITDLGAPVSDQDLVTKEYVDTRINKITVRAAHEGNVSNGSYFSFGAVDLNATSIGWTAFRSGRITDLGLSGCAGNGNLIGAVTITLVKNAVNQVGYTVTKGATVYGATTTFGTPLEFVAGDRIDFRSLTNQNGSQAFVASFFAELD